MKKFILTFEEACAALGCSTELPDVSAFAENKQKRLIADHKLEKILEVNNKIDNDGQPWEADLANTDQRKYYPYFEIHQEAEAPGGFRLSSYDCSYDGGYADVGARHACKSRELAIFMGENCADIYHDTLG